MIDMHGGIHVSCLSMQITSALHDLVGIHQDFCIEIRTECLLKMKLTLSLNNYWGKLGAPEVAHT